MLCTLQKKNNWQKYQKNWIVFLKMNRKNKHKTSYYIKFKNPAVRDQRTI